jgi:ADP-heptose:LPS heptosyltransferase
VTVLALRALGIGDLAVAVPALRGLRAAFPDRQLTLAAPEWLAPLVELTGAVDRLVPVSGVEGPVPPGPSPTVAVNLHGSGPESHRLLRATRPGRLLGYACPAAGFHHGPQWFEEQHEAARWCRLLDWYGIRSDPDDLWLLRPRVPAPVRDATVLHPGSNEPARRWPEERFTEVAARLHRDGHRVVVTGSTVDEGRARRIAAGAGLPPESVLAGRTGLGELAALIAAARLVVSGDTGAAHLATGYGTRSVVLFGPVPPQRWGPPRRRPQHRVLYRGGELSAITVDEVLAAARQAAKVPVRLRAAAPATASAIE